MIRRKYIQRKGEQVEVLEFENGTIGVILPNDKQRHLWPDYMQDEDVRWWHWLTPRLNHRRHPITPTEVEVFINRCFAKRDATTHQPQVFDLISENST